MVKTRLVELVGPAGAGKSALQKALLDGSLGAAQGHGLWNQPRGALLRGAASIVPAALVAAKGGQPLVPQELGQMVRLAAMERTLADVAAGRRVVVMDEGPVFALSWFDVFFGRNGDAGWSPWRRRMLDTWSQRLDAIVRVDAADELLAKRIRERDKQHMMKHRTFEEICGFNGLFRDAFDRVTGEMVKVGNVRVIDLRSDELAPEDLVSRLGSALEHGDGR